MKQRRHLTAFYLETLIMILVVIGILLVLTQVMGSSRNQSARAKRLTEAVVIAQNTAEMAAQYSDLSDLGYALHLDDFEKDGEEFGKQHCEGTWRWEHLQTDKDANVQLNYYETDYRVSVDRTWEDNMARDIIEVRVEGSEEATYTLEAKTYQAEEEAA